MQHIDNTPWDANKLPYTERTYLRLMLRMGNVMYVMKMDSGEMYVATNREHRHYRYAKFDGKLAFRITPKHDYILPGYGPKF